MARNSGVNVASAAANCYIVLYIHLIYHLGLVACADESCMFYVVSCLVIYRCIKHALVPTFTNSGQFYNYRRGAL